MSLASDFALTTEQVLRLAEHGIDDNAAEKPKKKSRGEGSGRHGYTSFSYACRTNKHWLCTAKKCQCSHCNHGLIL